MLIEIFLILLTVFFLWKSLRMPPDSPPGRWGLPLIGSLPLFEKDVQQTLTELNKKFGDVVSWRLGSKHAVFIFDYKLVKEALSGQDFVDRPHIKTFQVMIPGETEQGLVFSNGIHWHNLRRFSLRHLRDLGMGKSRLVSAIQYEANELVKNLQKQEGTPAHLPETISIPFVNIIWQMVASKRYDFDDKEQLEFGELIHDIQKNVKSLMIPDMCPWIEKIVPSFILQKVLKADSRIILSNKMKSFFMRFIDEHKNTLDVNDPRDYIDSYLIEMDSLKDDPSSTMTIDDLSFCIADLFAAGSETTSATLRWSILYLAKYTEVQKKLQKEIDEVIPKGTSATLDDKPSLSYTEAFITEVLRHSSLLAIGVMHTCTKDVNFGGYRIPKNAMIFGVSYTSHYNPKYFDSPTEFRPERFLNDEGKYVSPKEGFLPFGIGRRQCLGEALARMELFVFVTTLIQNLTFSTPPGETIDLNPVTSNPLLNLPNIKQNILLETR